MNDKLDALLTSDETVTPSPGFVASVMQAVHQSAKAPSAIRFPWRRFAAGILLGLLCLTLGIPLLLGKDLSDIRWVELTTISGAVNQTSMITILYSTLILVGSILLIRLTVEFVSE